MGLVASFLKDIIQCPVGLISQHKVGPSSMKKDKEAKSVSALAPVEGALTQELH
jgi:hypothetical protein